MVGVGVAPGGGVGVGVDVAPTGGGAQCAVVELSVTHPFAQVWTKLSIVVQTPLSYDSLKLLPEQYVL